MFETSADKMFECGIKTGYKMNCIFSMIMVNYNIQGIKRRGRCLHRPANGQMWASVPTKFFVLTLTKSISGII